MADLFTKICLFARNAEEEEVIQLMDRAAELFGERFEGGTFNVKTEEEWNREGEDEG